jgi:hypothetical protein
LIAEVRRERTRRLTDLAGLDAKTVIWIARRIRDEHRPAVEWLNTNTAETFRFFAVEVELWKIGGCLPAPHFNIVVKANDWVKLERAQQAQASAASLCRPDKRRAITTCSHRVDHQQDGDRGQAQADNQDQSVQWH